LILQVFFILTLNSIHNVLYFSLMYCYNLRSDKFLLIKNVCVLLREGKGGRGNGREGRSGREGIKGGSGRDKGREGKG